MATYVTLLRGINVGGNNKVPMKELKSLCSDLGFENARTVLASGNLVLESKLTSTATVGAKLEEAVAERFGVSCRVIVLTAEEFLEILAADPISAEGRKSDWLTVMFLPEPAPRGKVQQQFMDAHQGPELVEFGERAIYIYYTEGIARSRLALDRIRPRLEGTVRNRNTLKKLEGLLATPD